MIVIRVVIVIIVVVVVGAGAGGVDNLGIFEWWFQYRGCCGFVVVVFIVVVFSVLAFEEHRHLLVCQPSWFFIHFHHVEFFGGLYYHISIGQRGCVTSYQLLV